MPTAREVIIPHLPDDVFLAIVAATDIDTFLTLCLLSRSRLALITTYFVGLTAEVAKATFPNHTRLYRHLIPPKTVAEGLQWLKDLRYQQLAAVLIECITEHSVAAEDSIGDETRRLIARGWRVFGKFHRIWLQECAPFEGEGCDEIAEFGHLRQRELEACRRQMRLVDDLELDDIRAYVSLCREIGRAFTFSSTAEPRSAQRSVEKRVESCIRSEIGKHILIQLGPEAFWTAWYSPWSAPNDEPLAQKVLSAVTARHNLTMVPAQHGAFTLKRQVQHICATVGEKLRATPVGPGTAWPTVTQRERCLRRLPIDFRDASDERKRRTRKGEALPVRLLGQVPFAQHLGPTSNLYGPRSSIGYSSSAFREQLNGTFISRVMPESISLFDSWKREWKEREGWRRHIQDLWEELEGGKDTS